MDVSILRSKLKIETFAHTHTKIHVCANVESIYSTKIADSSIQNTTTTTSYVIQPEYTNKTKKSRLNFFFRFRFRGFIVVIIIIIINSFIYSPSKYVCAYMFYKTCNTITTYDDGDEYENYFGKPYFGQTTTGRCQFLFYFILFLDCMIHSNVC